MNVYSEFNWVNFDDIYSYTGLTSAEWDKLSMPQKVTDLLPTTVEKTSLAWSVYKLRPGRDWT